LTYAARASALADLAGPGLGLDTYDGWGFFAIALVETQNLRPKPFPRWLGYSFFLSGYRLFTRFARPGKQTLRGLRILRSDTDRRVMVHLGNAFTGYNYKLAKVAITADDAHLAVRIRTEGREADLDVRADLTSRPASLPEGTPFRSLEDARSFAGPLPYTFHFDADAGKMVVIKGLRQSWDPQPVRVAVREATWFEQPSLRGAEVHLANAFYLESVPYAWKPGTLEAIA